MMILVCLCWLVLGIIGVYLMCLDWLYTFSTIKVTHGLIFLWVLGVLSGPVVFLVGFVSLLTSGKRVLYTIERKK